jgi:hypothetical protein
VHRVENGRPATGSALPTSERARKEWREGKKYKKKKKVSSSLPNFPFV